MGLLSRFKSGPQAAPRSGKGLGFSLTVYFDEFNPSNEDASGQRKSLSHLDYSPLPRITKQSFFMGVLVSMGGFLFGYDTGQISGFLEMPDFLERFGQIDGDGNPYFSNVRSGLIVGLLSIGTLIGALIGGPVADWIGRRPSVSLWCVVLSIGFVVQISADTKWYQVMMGRWVAGLGVGALSLLVPMYQAETAPRYIRGALISTYQLLITIGIFLAACFNYGTYEHQRGNSGSWRIVIGLGWVFAAILGFGILLFPETPRFDYRHGKVDKAKQTMMKVYGAPENHYVIQMELEEIEAKLRAEANLPGGIKEWYNMMFAPRMAYRILLGVVLQMFQQLTGANFFFYYGTTIFDRVGIDNSFITQIILNGVNFGVTPIGIYLVEAAGRRNSLICGSVWMFLMFLIFASCGHFALDDNPDDTGVAMIVVACLFILGFATTWGPMVWTICGELYPSRYRGKGMALSTASNWLWNFLIAFWTPFIISDIDFLYGYVFAGCNIVAGLIVFFFVMEGQGRTLEELDTMYIEKVVPWNSKKWVAPSPEEIARIRKEAGTHDAAEAAEARAVAGGAADNINDSERKESHGTDGGKEGVQP